MRLHCILLLSPRGGTGGGAFTSNHMKHLKPLLSAAIALALASCGTDGGHFRLEGRLLNLNQGEFYVYSPDGDMRGLDTIKVQAGRFSYTTECTSAKTLMIVFPNFTEQPVFAQPGKDVDIKGDASHLKEMTVKGTKDNELMNKFREQIVSASPPEILKYARQFATDHPASAVAPYLVRRYFIENATPDYATASLLLTAIGKAQPDNAYVARLKGMIAGRDKATGATLPPFGARDIDGRNVSGTQTGKDGTTVIMAWATWNYTSTNQLTQLAQRANASNGRLKVIAICLDPDVKACRRLLKQRSIEGITVICDGQMVDSPLYRRLAFCGLPDNIVVKNGRIAERSLSTSDLLDKVSTAQAN